MSSKPCAAISAPRSGQSNKTTNLSKPESKPRCFVIAVFHTNAGHVTLNDGAYNADRNVATGNPYKELLADLRKHGVQIELCGATAQAHNWGNADLLPAIKVNRNAMARTAQLVQEGFVKITE